MRRAVLAFLIIIITICCFAIADAASLVSHEVEETEVSISVPDSWCYADHGVSDTDPICQVYGMSADQLKHKLDELDCSLFVISDDTAIWDFVN